MRKAGIIGCILALCGALCAGQSAVSGTVRVRAQKGAPAENAGVVVSLVPAGGFPIEQLPKHVYRLTQKDKHFTPHLLVMTMGSSVEFPNKDPFFHNVFSVYEGTRFDLGLYESGTSRTVKFTKPGPSYIFCNIHPQMSAVILALPTPYFGITDNRGEFAIRGVPPGEYDLRFWYERATPKQLEQLGRRITVSGSEMTLPAIELESAPSLAEGHKDKYGKDYHTGGYTIP